MKLLSWFMLTTVALALTVQAQVVTTVAGGGSVGGTTAGHADGVGVLATLGLGFALACDGNLCYIGDGDKNRHVIRVMNTTTYEVTTVAGGGSGAYVDGIGPAAVFLGFIRSLTISGDYLYIGDGYKIRMMDRTTYQVTTIAGRSDSVSVITDGIGTTAAFSSNIYSLAISGNILYIGDSGFIRIMNLTSYQVTTVAGSVFGTTDGVGTAASMGYMLRGFCISGRFLYFADTINNLIRRMDLMTYQVTTLAGSTIGFADGTGASAAFNGPYDMSLIGNILYIVDSLNNVIRAMNITTNEVTTYAGGGSAGGTQQGFVDGTGVVAQFHSPVSSAVGTEGLYVYDFQNHAMRLVTAIFPTTGSPTTAVPPTPVPLATAANATVVIPLPAGADLSPSDLQALYIAIATDAGTSLSVSMPTVAHDAATNLPYIVFVVTKTGSGSLGSALQATSFSSAKAVLQQKGVPFSQVALCVACTDGTLCNAISAQISCRASISADGTSIRCSDGCIAGLVIGLAVTCGVAFFAVIRHRQHKAEDSATPKPVP